MKKILLFTLICIMSNSSISLAQLQYPKTKKVSHTDNYFGVEVRDDYQWMEDQQSPDLKEFIKNQDELTLSYLNKIPYREKIRERLTEIMNYPKYTAPFKQDGYYYFYKNDGLQNQSVLYRQKDLNSEPEVFIDPNKFSADGTVALTMVSFSKDSKYCVYGIAKAGSDWNEYFILDVKSKEKLSDHLEWIKFSSARWLGNGFFYNRYDKPEEGKLLSSKNENAKVYFHRVGTAQSEDELIYGDTVKQWVRYFVSEDEKYIYKTITKVGFNGNQLYYKKADEQDFKVVNSDFKVSMSPVNNTENELYLFTNLNAPKNKIIKFSLIKKDILFEDVIPVSRDVLSGASMCREKLVLKYRKDVCDRIYVYGLDGKMRNEISLPSLGTAGISVSDKDDPEIFYTFTSFTYPFEIYKYDVDKDVSQLFLTTEVKFNSGDYETKQVFYESKDGTAIPMFIVHKKNLEMKGNNPAWLYGYGGFNVTMNPTFSPSRIVFLENGGVIAIANLRGGGEYGEEWHTAGTQLNKQNVFDDFIAAAEYLIKTKYTSSKKLVIEGGSNGGLLVAAVMNQRPELFRVAIPSVGVMDMLRFHKFTIGWSWVTDYGSSDDSIGFNNLIKYSPLHNLKEGVEYPSVLAFTSDHDDRVVPAHTFKYMAKLQEVYKGNNPVLLRVETDAGHSAGKSVKKVIEEQTDKWSFVFYNLGIEPIYK